MSETRLVQRPTYSVTTHIRICLWRLGDRWRPGSDVCVDNLHRAPEVAHGQHSICPFQAKRGTGSGTISLPL